MSEATKQYYRLHPRARFRELFGEGLVVQQQAGEVLTLNRIGARVLRAVTQSRSVDEIANEIAHKFSVSSEVALGDTEAFIDSLLQASVIEATPHPNTDAPLENEQ